MTSTTIKVPSDLRDRLNAEAKREGKTVAGVIEGLLESQARADRFRAIRAARDRMTPAERADLEAERALFEPLQYES
jgi:predicted DNA-binding protein